MSGNFLSKINPVQNKLFLKNLVHKTLSLFYELREKVIDCLVENNESIQNNYEHKYELAFSKLIKLLATLDGNAQVQLCEILLKVYS